ncbi:TrkA C-terminal domain-containing protein, partial [Acinetobacter baumannii]|nr:TrkA C-terminal domain-containing protein [Acinetobacter baumannii]
DDVLYLSGSPERINLLIAENALLPQKQDEAAAGLNFYDVGMAEILILPTSALVGRTVAQADFRATYGLNILGIRRHD